MTTLSNDQLEARANEALELIAEARRLEEQARATIQRALKLATVVLKQTDAPYIYDKHLGIIIYPRHPSNIKPGINPITHARTEHTTAAALQRILLEVRNYKYSIAVARLNAANLAAEKRRTKERGFKQQPNPYGI